MFSFFNSRSSSHQRKFARSKRVTFQQLEPRQLLAAGGIATSYLADFGSEGWSYSYNAGRADLLNQRGSLTALTNTNGTYSADDRDASARSLFLNKLGGHPGDPQFVARGNTVRGNSADRYAIATWTVPESGYYEIADSRLEVPNARSNGVDYRVYVNNQPPITVGVAQEARISYFDSRLGFLSKGDSVGVAFGANGNAAFDYFRVDFNIVRNDRLLQTVAQLDDAFAGVPTSRSDWRLLWNAPDQWRPGQNATSRTSLATGGIDQPTKFQPLQRATSDPVWTADGNLLPDGRPDRYLKLSGAPLQHPDLPNRKLFAGHPGEGFGNSKVLQDRFVIAEFTVPQSGFYAVNQSLFDLAHRSSGVEVVVGTSAQPTLFRKTIRSSGLTSSAFDVDLGNLTRGDKIYVAFGAGGFHTSDRFETNFDIVRVLPREQPLRQLAPPQATLFANQIEGIRPNDRQNDYEGIKTLLDRAAEIASVAEHDAPVRVVFQPGIYNIKIPEGVKQRALFEYSNISGLVIEGGGAQFFVESPLVGLFTLSKSSDVIFRNFQVDYVERSSTGNRISTDTYRATTLSQGRVVGVPNFSDNSIVVRFDPAVTVAPNREFFSRSASPQLFATLVDPAVPGRLKFDTDHFISVDRRRSGVQLTHTDYRVVFDQPEQLHQIAANDRIVFHRRTNAAVFSFFAGQSRLNSPSSTEFNGSQDVTLSNVTAWSSPGTFVSSIGTQRLNVINSRVLIRNGRWRSISADALHIQSSREGAWTEDSYFAGGADDAANFYTLPLAINQRLFNPREMIVTAVANAQKSNINRGLFKVGDRLQFFDPVKGEIIQEARIEKIGPGVLRDGVTMTKLTFDQAITREAKIYTENDIEKFGDDTQIFNRDLSKNFLVQETQFRNSRRYGTFLMAENVQLVDNTYAGLSDAAIAGHNEAGWPLGNLPGDILIQNNRFNRIGFSREFLSQGYATGVVSFQLDRNRRGLQFGRQTVDRLADDIGNLVISDNTFRLWGKAAISIRNSRHVTIENNRIFWYGADGKSTPLSPIEVKYSSAVSVRGTAFVKSNRTSLDNFFATEGNGDGNVLEPPVRL